MFNFLKILRYATRSSKWSAVRKQHLKENSFCLACGKNTKLEVHHKIPVHISPELELDPSNLVTLCADPCHILFGHLMSFRSYNKTVIEDCSVYLSKVKNRP
jgi:hypothetical protein